MSGLSPSPESFLGHCMIGKTAYKVYRLGTGENSRRAGIVGNYALEGPKGAWYFVTDRGPKYMLNSTACGGSKTQHWTPAPRPLRGLTRESMSLFLEVQS